MADKKEFVYDPFKYKEYTESDAVKGWGDKLTTAEQAVAGYGDFSWKDQDKYNTLLGNYENRPDFTYDFNADALYQQYKDKYIQQGKMAMADTMGQAAAMTGGYGNSYAASVGNQAYQAHLSNLNDVIPELYQMALDKYNQKGTDMLNMLSLMRGDRDFEYGKWSDKYNQLVADRSYFGTMYDNERDFDYGKYSADRTLAHDEHSTTQGYAYNNYRDAIADEQWKETYDLSERELKMAEDKWALEKADSYKGYTATPNEDGTVSYKETERAEDNNVIPDSIKTKAASFTNNDALDSYLMSQYKAGKISEEQMGELYAENEISSLTKRNWTLTGNGGINWFGGVDNNATVKDQYGNSYRLDKLVDALVAEGMSKSEAKTYVKKLQAQLGA